MKASRLRSIVGLVAAAVVLGVFTLSPVAAHFTTNTKHLGKHAWQQFIKQKAKKTLGTVASGAVDDADIDDFTAGAFTSILSTNIQAPKKGVLLILGNVSGADDASLAGAGEFRFRLRLDGTPVTDDPFAYSQGTIESMRWTGGASAVVPVTKGMHTVHLDARETGTGSYIFIRDVSVIFFPSGNGVTIPASASRSQGAPGSDQPG